MEHPWKKQSLNGSWQMWLTANETVIGLAQEPSSAEELSSCGFTAIQATVPGNFELDMQQAGLIEEPFYGTNILSLQDLENRHIWYAKTFFFSGTPQNAWLQFEGIDTYADIYLNGTLLASTDNMLIPYEIKAQALRSGKNELFIHITPAAIVARNHPLDSECFAMKYNYASLGTRKAPHMYGWDIMPRALSGGIWRSVSLIEKPQNRIDDVFIHTVSVSPTTETALLSAYYRTTVSSDCLQNYRIRIHGTCGDSSFDVEDRLWHTEGKLSIPVNAAQFWWPGNLGNPSLYLVTAELLLRDEVQDTVQLRTGIRTVSLDRTSVTDIGGSGEFCFRINGEKWFAKGTNWVPLDAFHSRDQERLPKALALLKDIGCNMVRCWGGNVYENDLFFDFCDENGILVWQDFAMACGIYPQNEAFCSAIAQEVEAVVKRLRNHPCIGLWAGDNENDVAYEEWAGIPRDPNQNILTRSVIPTVLRRLDSSRPYLPSSPYIDSYACGKGTAVLPEFHLWGPRDNFKSKFYSASAAHFASEMGYHGCPSPASVKRFISPDRLWPWENNPEWFAHAASPEAGPQGIYSYRIELMAKQIHELFCQTPETLEQFAMLSQISQAEAFKFFIELFRAAKWRRTGIIWWNLLDGWPQFSDAVVDYYFTKKLAYHFMKASSQPICLMFAEPDNWELGLMGANDTLTPAELHYTVHDLMQDNRLIIEGDTVLPPNSTVHINQVRYSMSEHHFYLIQWDCSGVKSKNHYLAGHPPYDRDQYLACLKQAGLYRFEGFSQA